MGAPANAPTEVDWLASDIDQYQQAIARHSRAFAVLGDHTDPDLHNFHEIVVDLYMRAHHYAIGMHCLITERLEVPANAVARAFLEVVVNLGYLCNCPNRIGVAVTMRAYSHIKETKLFGTDQAVVAERAAILRRMPERWVRLARHRAKKHEHWSGISLKRMASVAGVTGLMAHAYLSEDVHARIAGRLVALRPTGTGKAMITLGRAMSDESAEDLANFVRRLLHGAFGQMWTAINAPHVVIPGRNALEWPPNGAAANERADA